VRKDIKATTQQILLGAEILFSLKTYATLETNSSHVRVA